MENGDILSGLINGKVKGGLTVMINSIRAFLPGSLLDVRPIKDTSHFEGKEIEFKVINWTKNATMLLFPAVLFWKQLWAKNAKPCWKTCKKAL